MYLRKRTILGLLTICLTHLYALAQAPIKDRDTVTVSGSIKLVHRGYSQFLLTKTDKSYRLIFDPDESDPKVVNEFGLHLDGQYDTLLKHTKERITVSGRMQLEGVSPYYWNGALVIATKVVLEDKTVLEGRPYKSNNLPSSVERYRLIFTLMPGLLLRKLSAQDLSSGKAIEDIPGCDLNGGRDVLNCYCADNFSPINGHMGKETGESMDSFWQFSLPEYSSKPVTAVVECGRLKDKK